MSFGKFIVIPIGLAIQAFILMLIAKYVPGSSAVVGGPGLLIFVTFQCWATYFVAGCTPKGGAKVIIAYFIGISASILIMLMGDRLAVPLGSAEAPNYWMSYAVAVLIVVVPVICFEKVPMCDFIPGIFFGSGMFFAIMTLGGSVALVDGEAVKVGISHDMAGFKSVMIPEMTGCIVGQIFGWITVFWRGAYEKSVGAGEEAPAE
jgi:hypothetical protein